MLNKKFRLRDIGEEEALEVIQGLLGNLYSGGLLELRDDASAIKVEGTLIVKIDGTSESASRYDWMSIGDLAYRVLASASVDVIAKGGIPEYALISLGVPPNRTLDELRDLTMGIKDFIRKYNMTLLGGDLNASSEDTGVWVDAVVLGKASKLVGIGKAVEGDRLCITGCIGLSALPAIASYVLKDSGLLRGEVLRKIRRPKLPIDFLKIIDKVKASTDISDGLRSLMRFLEINGLSLTINDDLPLCEEVLEFMSNTGVKEDLILKYMGEEYLIAYVPCDDVCYGGLKLGILRKGKPEILFKGRKALGGWDNFKGYLNT